MRLCYVYCIMPLDKKQRAIVALAAGLFAIAAIIVAAAFWLPRSQPPVESSVVQPSPAAEPAPQSVAAPQPTSPADISLGPQRVVRRVTPPAALSAPAPLATVVMATPQETRPSERRPDQPKLASAVEPAPAPLPAQPVGTYSALDAGVTPPAARRELSLQRVAVRTDDIVTIELLVDEAGRVETAKVQNDSETIADTMLYAMALQAIRSWEFHPAMKAGTPVRYRQMLVLRGTGQEVASNR